MNKGRACAVLACQSTKRSLRHRFPKDPVKSYVWACGINNLHVKNLCSEERQKLFVCHLHFPKEAYKVTLKRCKLVDTAVPYLNVPGKSPENPAPNEEPLEDVKEIQLELPDVEGYGVDNNYILSEIVNNDYTNEKRDVPTV